MNKNTEQRIRELLSDVMERVIYKRVVKEPFSEEELKKTKPFGSHLVPMEIWKGSKFERSFVTTLGQTIFEKLGKIIAEGTGSYASLQHDEEFYINTFRNEKIEEILESQRESSREPNWEKEVEEILSLHNKDFTQLKVRFDLYVRRQNGHEEFYSFKTVQPNLDQTERAKRDMLRIKSGKPDCGAFFALPYNPSGEGNLYSFSLPKGLFNMNSSPAVLIGSKLWNKLGEDDNTYDKLIQIFSEVGTYYSKVIRRDYLEIIDENI